MENKIKTNLIRMSYCNESNKSWIKLYIAVITLSVAMVLILKIESFDLIYCVIISALFMIVIKKVKDAIMVFEKEVVAKNKITHIIFSSQDVWDTLMIIFAVIVLRLLFPIGNKWITFTGMVILITFFLILPEKWSDCFKKKINQ